MSNVDYKIIDNVLPQEEFENIKNFVLNPNFSWNLTPVVTNKKENLSITASYYFTHEFWCGFNTEPQAQVFAPLMNRMECKAVIRIKGNLYPSTETIVHHDNHCDYELDRKSVV